MSYQYTFTSESVSEGHPDKVCDFIADSILDAYIEQDPKSRVACEVLCKQNDVILAGEITSNGEINHEKVVRDAIRHIGYTDKSEPFNADGVRITQLFTKQSPQIAQGVNTSTNTTGEQGAGDQGIMFGYATNETPELMPLPIQLAHRLAERLAGDRKKEVKTWLRPDVKTQVSVLYEGNKPLCVTDVLVSTQHAATCKQDEIREYIQSILIPNTLGEWFNCDVRLQVNPTGDFSHGGPSADCGVTGRKIIVDTYGGAGRHGGGAFSGKDPSKVDRSGAYYCRYVARQVLKEGLAGRAEVQVAYAIGVAQPVSVKVETFGTGDECAAAKFVKKFDFRPQAIIEQLDLIRPIYRTTTNYGHFGKSDLSWEK